MGRDPDGKAKMINVDENGNVKVQQSGDNVVLYKEINKIFPAETRTDVVDFITAEEVLELGFNYIYVAARGTNSNLLQISISYYPQPGYTLVSEEYPMNAKGSGVDCLFPIRGGCSIIRVYNPSGENITTNIYIAGCNL